MPSNGSVAPTDIVGWLYDFLPATSVHKRWFEPTIIVTCVRWYLRFSLSLRDVSALIAERGLSGHHTSIWKL